MTAVLDVAAVVLADPWRCSVLEAVRQQHLPDWAVGAGFIRAAVWDALHGYRDRTPLPDVDVLYFDRDDISREREAAIEETLTRAMADVPWSVRNQARMHLRNGDPPYTDTADALRFWLETPTAIAIRIDDAGYLSLLAPFGTGDLTDMICRPTPRGREKSAQYRSGSAARTGRRAGRGCAYSAHSVRDAPARTLVGAGCTRPRSVQDSNDCGCRNAGARSAPLRMPYRLAFVCDSC